MTFFPWVKTRWCWAKQHLIQAHDLSLFSALLKREWMLGKPASKSTILYCSFFLISLFLLV